MRAKREIKSVAKSFRNAFRGITSVVRYERNFRIHICIIVYVLVFSVIGEVERADISRFILCFGIVLTAELANTAIELLANAQAKGFDGRVRDIKDIAAGAVLVSAIASAAVGLSVFLSPEVFGRIAARLASLPILSVGIVLSLPLAIWFIIGRKKK